MRPREARKRTFLSPGARIFFVAHGRAARFCQPGDDSFRARESFGGHSGEKSRQLPTCMFEQ